MGQDLGNVGAGRCGEMRGTTTLTLTISSPNTASRPIPRGEVAPPVAAGGAAEATASHFVDNAAPAGIQGRHGPHSPRDLKPRRPPSQPP
ncbi:hypothetical protein VTI74DRAFT_5237 [Chaetomium olivicolor]